MRGAFSLMPVMFTVIAGLIALVFVMVMVKGIGQSRTTSRLASQGLRTTGRVVASHARTTGGGSDTSVRTQLVETIEFTTGDGRTVRGNPVASDLGMLDRSGADVTVFYDRDSPEQFIAPKDGQRLRSGGGLTGVIFLVVVLGIFGIIAVLFGSSIVGGSSPGF